MLVTSALYKKGYPELSYLQPRKMAAQVYALEILVSHALPHPTVYLVPVLTWRCKMALYDRAYNHRLICEKTLASGNAKYLL
jgi:hypothetical protein